MLKQLIIKNIILIESATITFEAGFNALSGETGSGKSAILAALSLVLGAKADMGLMRHGTERAATEAFFEIKPNPPLSHLLEEAGIDLNVEEGLIVKREMHSNGKSRSFINNQAVNVNFLKTIAPFLGSLVSQHACLWLRSTDKHRDIVDIYGGHQKLREAYTKSFIKEMAIKTELKMLVESEQKRFRESEIYKAQIEEIHEANLKSHEEEEVFAEYTLLTHAENLKNKASEIEILLQGGKTPFLTLLNKQKANFDYLCEIDPTLKDVASSFQNALLELEEVSYSVRSYLTKIECNPEKTEQLNARLALIAKLKKKYGNSVLEIENYKKEALEKLKALETIDEKIEILEASLTAIENENALLALDLRKKRELAAKKLEKAISEELKSLNMSKAIFEVSFQASEKNKTGIDFIEFYMTPNKGEHKIPVKESASGGELSRILLSFQNLLAEKEETPTLIFDEIDGNIGGETASIVGEKLKKMGKYSQVICITHFPQVAKQADHHLSVCKKEEMGRTFTEVISLKGKKERLQELTRMMGGSPS